MVRTALRASLVLDPYAPELILLQCVDLRDPTPEAFSAIELRGEESLDERPRQLDANDAATKAEDVHVVMDDALRG